MTPTKFQHAGLDWIPHTPGDPMPCLGHVEVRIFQRCDAKSSRQELEVSQEASSWDWSECGASSIVGWHPVEEQPCQKELLSSALRALCLTRDYVGERLLPAIKGWDWFDVGCEIAAALPDDEWAHQFHLRVQSAKHEIRKELE